MTKKITGQGRLEPTPFDDAMLNRLPQADDLASDLLTVNPLDPDFAPPALTNQWSGVMAGRDPFSYRGFSAPTLYHEGVQAELLLGLGGESLRPAAERSQPLHYRWYPSRIVRTFSWAGLEFESELYLSVRRQVVLNRLTITNSEDTVQTINLMLRLLADVRGEWHTTWPPEDTVQAQIALDENRGAIRLLAPKCGVCALAGAAIPPVSMASFAENDTRWDEALATGRLDGQLSDKGRYAALHYSLTLEPHAQVQLRWVHALAEDENAAEQDFDSHLTDFDAHCADVRDAWQTEWEAAFTPGSGRFSGVAPLLECANPKVTRLYTMGIMTLLYCKRTPHFGGIAETYITGFPSSTETFAINWVFPWDTKMVSGILSLLDPAVLRGMMVRWIGADLHGGCALDFVTREPVGFWYAVNDYALIHMCYQYLRYTGDTAFLAEGVRGKSVLDHLKDAALYYQKLAGEDGLADYGEAENLLECVGSYTHKVASFNAANVWNLRTVARSLQHEARDNEATGLLELADTLLPNVLSLYEPGEGVWTCLQPDGSRVPVRHCLDFFTTAQCLSGDLSAEQLGEMVAFFLRELRTETWMHALSPLDPDTAFSSRTDHQDEGAYTTWPAYCFEVLVQTGHEADAVSWLGDASRAGLADVTRQGPFGQAYCHGDEGSPRLAGAGAKAPMEMPHIEKPVLVSGGKYAQIIVEALAGLEPVLFGDLELHPRQLPFSLTLYNLSLRGGLYKLQQGHAPG